MTEYQPLGAEIRPGRRKAKIVCTIGPSSGNETALRDLMRTGMDVARLNFSHGTHEEHARMIERLRRVAKKEGKSICILQDLQGPKIRTGRLKNRIPIALKAGTKLVITPEDVLGTPEKIATTFQTLAREVQPGARILLSDGLIELRVKAIHGADVECEVVNGGFLGESKGINLPGTIVSVPSLTEKDQSDLEFGLSHGADMIAMSFVRSGDDVRYVKRRVRELNSNAWVIAKLEKPEAIEHLEDILDVADGVMVARGDLGVEMPPEKVPIIQKHIIRRATEWRKPVITATQMLESMIENPRPTRAEASDVANAVFDGTDALMLSAETASGKYPREAVAIMARIVNETERHMDETGVAHRRRDHRALSISETICESVAHAALDLEMRAIAVFTETGTTARLISKYRPQCRIFAFSHRQTVCNRSNLYWGVHPISCEESSTSDDMVQDAEKELLKMNAADYGDVVGIVAGTQKATGSTNFLRLHVVGADDGAGITHAQLAKRRERRKAPRHKPLPERRKR